MFLNLLFFISLLIFLIGDCSFLLEIFYNIYSFFNNLFFKFLIDYVLPKNFLNDTLSNGGCLGNANIISNSTENSTENSAENITENTSENSFFDILKNFFKVITKPIKNIYYYIKEFFWGVEEELERRVPFTEAASSVLSAPSIEGTDGIRYPYLIENGESRTSSDSGDNVARIDENDSEINTSGVISDEDIIISKLLDFEETNKKVFDEMEFNIFNQDFEKKTIAKLMINPLDVQELKPEKNFEFIDAFNKYKDVLDYGYIKGEVHKLEKSDFPSFELMFSFFEKNEEASEILKNLKSFDDNFLEDYSKIFDTIKEKKFFKLSNPKNFGFSLDFKAKFDLFVKYYNLDLNTLQKISNKIYEPLQNLESDLEHLKFTAARVDEKFKTNYSRNPLIEEVNKFLIDVKGEKSKFLPIENQFKALEKIKELLNEIYSVEKEKRKNYLYIARTNFSNLDFYLSFYTKFRSSNLFIINNLTEKKVYFHNNQESVDLFIAYESLENSIKEKNESISAFLENKINPHFKTSKT